MNQIMIHGYGFNIITSELICDTIAKVEPRTLRERFFSRPWRPWKKTKVVMYSVPKQEYYVHGNNIYCHPAIAEQLYALSKLK